MAGFSGVLETERFADGGATKSSDVFAIGSLVGWLRYLCPVYYYKQLVVKGKQPIR